MFVSRTIAVLLCAGVAFAGHTCPADVGLSLNLDQDVGEWYMVAGSPVKGNKLSSCTKFDVSKISNDEFAMVFTAISRETNQKVTFDIKGLIGENGISATWKLRGSLRTLGPFWHVIVYSDEDFIIMVVCSDEFIPYVPNGKFSMIWSRERHPSAETLEDMQTKLAEYIDKDRILKVDQDDC